MKLSIIIISYNTKKLLKNCLGSFVKKLPKEWEVIVVDNGSEDGSPEMVKKEFPQVKLLKSKKNLGFAGGNNLGIKKSKGEYLLLLNSDTETTIKDLQSLLDTADEYPKAGIMSPQLHNLDGSIQQNGGALPNILNLIAWQFFIDEIPIVTHLITPYQREDLDFYTRNHKTGWVSGAAMLIRKECLDQIGLLDQEIFMYAEDLDLCWRAQKSGWQVQIIAESQVMHIGHASGDKSKALIGEYRGLKYVLGKHLPNWDAVTTKILYYGAVFRSHIFRLLGEHDKANIYTKAAQVVR